MHAHSTTCRKLKISLPSAALAVLALLAAQASAQPATEVELDLLVSGLGSIVDLQSAGDDRLFAVEQEGVIRVITFDGLGNASALATPFLDIGSLLVSGGERGLLGLAFHPEYASNGYLFVNYTCRASQQAACASDGDTIIARYTVSANPNVANPGSALLIASIPQYSSNHNGGGLQFEPFPAPDDGRTILYIGMGDGGGSNDPEQNAQDLGSLLGKLLRVDVDDPGPSLPRYHVPDDNPLIQGNVDEVWAYGLRNPWRFSFDALTGDLFIADVGQNAREEVNFQPWDSAGGENYGWRQCEGTRVNFADEAPDGCTGGGGLTPPILEYAHGPGCDSITGGYIYRGARFDAELGGTYFYADYCSGELWGARNGGGNWSNAIDQDTGLDFDIATFGQGHDGELYLATVSGGIYHIRPATPELVIRVPAFNGQAVSGTVDLRADVAGMDVAKFFIFIRRGRDGINDRICKRKTPTSSDAVYDTFVCPFDTTAYNNAWHKLVFKAIDAEGGKLRAKRGIKIRN